MSIEQTLLTWWPQLTALAAFVFYHSKVNASQDERVAQLEKKVENLFVLWNKHMDWLLSGKKEP